MPESSRFLDLFLPSNFALSNAEHNTCRPLNRGSAADVENTIRNSPKILRVKFLENDGFFCFIKKCKLKYLHVYLYGKVVDVSSLQNNFPEK